MTKENAAFANRNAKDSVFRNLFSDKKYLLELYRALHPEDTTATEDDLTYVTLEKVLTNGIYNDLSFTVGDRLMVIVEAQSSWSVNILVRCVMYLAQIWAEYIKKTEQSVYSSAPLELPEPEFYVVYVGVDTIKKEYITFSEEFFGGKHTALEITAQVITDGQQGDIINQYVLFTRVFSEQVRQYGRTREAITETLRICQDQNILTEYLRQKEKEVIDIMVTLFSQQEVMEDYGRSIRRVARAEGREEGKAEGRAEGRAEGHAEGREEGIRAMVLTLKRFAVDKPSVAQELMKQFELSLQAAEEKAAQYWGS